jgi:hypothetical protein
MSTLVISPTSTERSDTAPVRPADSRVKPWLQVPFQQGDVSVTPLAKTPAIIDGATGLRLRALLAGVLVVGAAARSRPQPLGHDGDLVGNVLVQLLVDQIADGDLALAFVFKPQLLGDVEGKVVAGAGGSSAKPLPPTASLAVFRRSGASLQRLPDIAIFSVSTDLPSAMQPSFSSASSAESAGT